MAVMKTYEDKQEMFDTIVNRMQRQKKFGVSKTLECGYLNELDESMCAIGILLGKPYVKKVIIPNNWNSEDASDLLIKASDRKVELPSWYNKKNLSFIVALQEAHDRSSNGFIGHRFADFYSAMTAVAKRYKLDRTKLDKVDWNKIDQIDGM